MQNRIGVIGTFIRDTIVTLDGRTVESIGGLYHTLAYLAYLTDGTTVLQPLCHIGEDFYPVVREGFAGFGSKIRFTSLHRVALPNTQVKLIYRTAETRDEVTSPPMPPLTAAEIRELAGCDVVLVNLITGEDIQFEALPALRTLPNQPLIYLDLHSLALGRDAEGRRFYREIPHGRVWLASCDILQMNEYEAATLAGWPVPLGATPATQGRFTLNELMDFGTQLVKEGLLACHITLGSAGSLVIYRNNDSVCSEHCLPYPISRAVDIIGCGDAFGAAFLAHLIKTNDLAAATRFANKIAALNCSFMGSLTPQAYRHFIEPYL
ncbi:MAG: carbohydrate kinase family protein [candidate division KSB1 bacterium]|nr:carbohydrate kinase family protein [candidate division KSB1 bacterium]